MQNEIKNKKALAHFMSFKTIQPPGPIPPLQPDSFLQLSFPHVEPLQKCHPPSICTAM